MKVTKLHGMGNHLMIDGHGCEESKLGDEKFIQDMLETLPNKIGLNKMTSPKVVYHQAKDKSESGVTGFVLLCESHISIHTYPKKGFMVLDIFSVKEFDIGKMIDRVKTLFSPTEIKVNLLKREYNDREKDKGFPI